MVQGKWQHAKGERGGMKEEKQERARNEHTVPERGREESTHKKDSEGMNREGGV